MTLAHLPVSVTMSLPKSAADIGIGSPPKSASFDLIAGSLTVAVGVMAYYGWAGGGQGQGQGIYDTYIDKLAGYIAWLAAIPSLLRTAAKMRWWPLCDDRRATVV